VIRNSREAEDLVARFLSPDAVPVHPVLLVLPSGDALIGNHEMGGPLTVRQLRDQAITMFEREQAILRADTKGLVLKERGGPVDTEIVQEQIKAQLIRQQQGIF